jgi:hypothetical protein
LTETPRIRPESRVTWSPGPHMYDSIRVSPPSPDWLAASRRMSTESRTTGASGPPTGSQRIRCTSIRWSDRKCATSTTFS